MLADDIDLTDSEGPDAEGLAALIELTVSTIADYPAESAVVFERSPIDYLTYTRASRSISHSEREELSNRFLPIIRDSAQLLDGILWVPVCEQIAARPGEDAGFRLRVDHELRRTLVDDELDLLDSLSSVAILDLSSSPDRRLAKWLRWINK